MLSLVLLLTACPPEDDTGSALHGVATAGECEGTPKGRVDGEMVTPDPGVAGTVQGSTLRLDYLDMEANCCPSPGVDVTVAGTDVTVDLWDVTTEDPCDCICVTDFEVTVDGLPSGELAVTARFNSAVIGILAVSMP